MESADENFCHENDRLSLSSWGLPNGVLKKYQEVGINKMFEWQADCLCTGNVLNGGNLVYCAPTSAGKTMVAELLMLKRVVETQKKAIMILPFVSVAREKMFYLQNIFQDAGVNVDGFIGSENPAGGFSSVSIAICTIEKANGLINRLLQEQRIDELGMVVVDELHMVGDSHRGYLLELLLTKLRFMSIKMQKKQDTDAVAVCNPIQIVGMSATLPNLDLLARWLEADLYCTDYRPVPLTEMVKIGKELFDNNLKKIRTISSELNVKDDDQIIQLCLETIFDGCSILIFCPTKAWCETLADTIAREFYRLIREPLKKDSAGAPAITVDIQALKDVCEQLRRTPVGIDTLLGKTVPQAVAFHHAGLTFDERDIVEGAFRQGTLKVLVATSTLSSGVNLPARRVIVRTPTFHGTLIDVLTYKQMIGRAGRKGIDTKGESVLVCKSNERAKAEQLVNCGLPPVRSCLQQSAEFGLSSSMKRAILEVVVSGVASTPSDVKAYANSTMLAASMIQTDTSEDVEGKEDSKGPVDAIEACIKFLKDNEFITLRKVEDQPGNLVEKFVPSQLGAAVLASALSPDEGLLVFRELQKARKCFVLENEMHIIYLITPIYMVISTIEWYDYLCMWENLSADMKRVAELVGVSESFLAKAVRGKIPKNTMEQERIFGIHKRFFTSMVLNDLVNEVSLGDVCKKYRCNRGTLQSLQQSAATFAGMVTVFCHKLGWLNLELLLSQFQSRLTFGVQRELVDLVRITLLNGQRARILYNGGYQTIANLSNADPSDIEILLKTSAPFMSKKKGEGETEWEAEERKKSHCIWLTGKKGVTEYEAAVLIVEEAKFWLQRDLLEIGVEWKPEKEQQNSKHNDKSSRQTILKPRSKSKLRSGTMEGVTQQNSKVKGHTTGRKTQTQRSQSKRSSGTCHDITNISISNKSQKGRNTSILSPPASYLKRKSVGESTGISSKKQQISGNASILSPPTSFLKRKSIFDSTEAAEVKKVKANRNAVNLSFEVKNNDKLLEKLNNRNTPSSTYLKKTKLNNENIQLDPVCLFNISGELDLTCLSCNSPVISRLESGKKKKSSQVTPAKGLRKSPRVKRNNKSRCADTPKGVKIVKGEVPQSQNHAKLQNVASKPAIKSHCVADKGAKTSNEAECVYQNKTDTDDQNCDNHLLSPVEKFKDNCGNENSKNIPNNSKLTQKRTDPANFSDIENFTVDTQTWNIMAEISTSWPSEELNGATATKSEEQHQNLGKESVKKRNDSATSLPLFTEDFDTEYQSPVRSFMINHLNEVAFSASPKLSQGVDDSPELIPASAFDRAAFDESLVQIRHGENICVNSTIEKDTGNILLPHPKRNQTSENEGNSKQAVKNQSVSERNKNENMVNCMKEQENKSSDSLFFDELNSIDFDNSFTSPKMMPVSASSTSVKHSLSEKVKKDNMSEPVNQINTKFEIKHGLLKAKSDTEMLLSPNTVAFLNDIVDDGHFDSFSNSFSKSAKNKSVLQCVKKIETKYMKRQAVHPPLTIQGCVKSAERKIKCKKSINLDKPGKSNIKVMNKSVNTSTSDCNASDCLPPTPTKSVIIEDTCKAATPSRLIGGTGRTPTRSQRIAQENVLTEQTSVKTPKDRIRCSQKQRIIKTSTPCVAANKINNENGENLFNLDESFPSTNQSFTIIDVCSNSALFQMFIEEWESQEYFSVSLACEKLPPTTTNPSETKGIGSNFVQSRKQSSVEVPYKVNGIVIEEMEIVITGLAVSWGKRDAYFIAFTNENSVCDLDESLAPPNIDHNILVEDRIQAVKKVLEGNSCVCAFDIKKHYKAICMGFGITVKTCVEDPKICDWLLDPGAKEKNLHRMVHNYLPLEVHLLQGIGGGIGFGSIGMNPENPGSGRLRSCVESVLVYHLKKYYEVELSKHELYNVYKELETSTHIILAKMELNGMGFSIDECGKQKQVQLEKLSSLEEQAYALAGHGFSLSSSSDISQVLFLELKLPPSGDPANPGFMKTLGPARRPTRGRVKQQYSTSKDVLEKLMSIHPLPGIILEWRKITNTLTKVIFPLQNEKLFCEKLHMYRIHGVSQTHTSTGRVSMQEPNLQNIPKDFNLACETGFTVKKGGKYVATTNESPIRVSMRQVFVPFEGGVILAADYSQLELRIIAHLSKDKQMIEILNSGVDVFKTIAAKWKGLSAEDITSVQRQQAKQVCYGMLYGIGSKALGEQLGVDENEAAVFMESFKSRFTGIRSYLRNTVKICRDNGYVDTIWKRRRYLPAIRDTNIHAKAHAERQAVNTSVQGSAADLVKKAMIDIDQELEKQFPDCNVSHRSLYLHEQPSSVKRKQLQPILKSPPRGAYFILQLHDELIYEVNKKDIEKVKKIVKYYMENAMKLSVVLPVKVSVGATWGTLEEIPM